LCNDIDEEKLLVDGKIVILAAVCMLITLLFATFIISNLPHLKETKEVLHEVNGESTF